MFITPQPHDPFFLICGPCVIESEKMLFTIAEHMVKLTQELE